MSIDDRMFKVFVLGFAASREGFNGECPYAELGPSEIFEQHSACDLTLDELMQRTSLIDKLRELWSTYV